MTNLYHHKFYITKSHPENPPIPRFLFKKKSTIIAPLIQPYPIQKGKKKEFNLFLFIYVVAYQKKYTYIFFIKCFDRTQFTKPFIVFYMRTISCLL